jgi:hypothetical protein
MDARAPVQHSNPAFEHARASMLLRRLADQDGAEQGGSDVISIGEMTRAFGERAFGILMIVFCLPNLIPTPGIGSLFGIPLLLIALQMAWGSHRPWLPRAIEAKTISRATLTKTVDVVEPRVKRLEAILRPRWAWLFSPTMDKAIGVFAALCAISIIIPFPGTNFLPAIALILISLAVMQEDALFLGLGAVIGVVGLTYTTIVVGGLAYAGWLAAVAWLGF